MAERKQVEIPPFLTVRELAERVGASPIDVIKRLMSNGIMASINQQIDFDTAAIVAEDMGFEARPLKVEEEAEEEEAAPTWRRIYADEPPESLKPRPPIVAVLGHVDHGKTSLLDTIRKTNVQAGEYGGITQRIGAYQVKHQGQTITFIDTPGHKAFTAMRARGAQGADIVVLVVAADDGVMPQTEEAISHARAAQVPIVVALNKIDKSNARPEQVKRQLADVGLVPDEWGGDTLVVPVSAKTGEGIEDLLEAILLVAAEAEIVANPDGKTAGTVLEAEMDRRRGVVATLLVQNGTLKIGDVVVAGMTYGRLRAMFDENGRRVKEAGPSKPVQVLGLGDVPEAGEMFTVVASDKEAKAIVEERKRQAEEATSRPRRTISLEEFFALSQDSETKELNLIVKVSAQGMLSPVLDSLEEVSTDDLKINFIHAGTGDVTESDVMLASTTNAVIIGFQVRVEPSARRLAEANGVDIRLYNIIYKLLEDVELALHGLLEPEYVETTIGKAEIRRVFRIPRVGKVAGCLVVEGEVRRNAQVRLWRGDEKIFEGRVRSLKRFDEDVREVRTGFECGIGLEGFDDIQEGDILEFFVVEKAGTQT